MDLIVRPLNRTLAVSPGANLLQLLREHNVPISYSCTAGRCGTCRCKVTRGHLLESGPEAQTFRVKEGQFALACMSVLTESCEIEVPEPDEIVIHPARVLKATVVAVEDMTHDIKRIVLRPARPLSFSPGQYAQLQFTPAHIRPYSMAGLASDEELEFHVRLVPGGRVSSYISSKVAVGHPVRVSGPLGTAYLREKHIGPMLCVAGGTGLAPILSIIRGAIRAGLVNPIYLYFGVRSPLDVYGENWLQDLAREYPNLSVQVIPASDATGLARRTGLVTDAIASDWGDGLKDFRAYLCGSPPMVEAASLLLEQRGIPPEHIYADAFYSSGT
ncbi:2Fe-2S iron-sulfur cluster-binding protein [Paraburkholderia susongensis]|uniref:Ferredoxin-NAD(P)+ reductase (Naphthalene dioxygenase ferredoxin-specific) n=1 Tax=Paraburkholderia susongensis TaxID=1515439 RepID=A0A1X7M2K2_9BURK|nr:2Fe-2S iron-sulfur cluster-binding protein [Paraburkholderia susongensis]SMG60406.1 ferredoxin-NAD(P)+ reductase (naphthalene dioxygenase ferredoxin-specific) [Paraburkholderia susongensis]